MENRFVFSAVLAISAIPACFNPNEVSANGTGSVGSTGSTSAVATNTETTGSQSSGPSADDVLTSAGSTSSPASTTLSGDPSDSSGDSAVVQCGDSIAVATELCFDDSTVIDINDVVYAPRIANINEDRYPDLVYLITDQVVIHFGDGAGDFGPAIGNATVYGTDIDIAEINDDGAADIFVLKPFAEQMDFLLGNGAGDFEVQNLNVLTGPDPKAIAVGDMDGNGFDDAVLISGAGSELLVFLAIGDGTVSVHGITSIGSFGRELALGDFTGDNILDVAFTVEGAPEQIRLCVGTGGGSLSTPLVVGTRTVNATGLAAGDFNADGRADLVVANETNILALLGTGTAGFENPVSLESAGQANLVNSVDLTSDGLADIIATYSDTPVISIFTSHGDGTFDERVDYEIASAADSLTTGDANLDGIPDVVVGSQNDELVTLLLSTP